jgi:serine/threonine-protein kinase
MNKTIELPREGDKIGSGMVVGIINAGGSARVYKTWVSSLELHRAVKVMDPDAGDEVRDRFGTEAKITSKLSHPNIVQVHSCGETESGLPYIEMDYVSGLTLDAIIRQYGALPLPVALAVIVNILDALHYAHTIKYTLYDKPHSGVMHRDIKPSNIIFSDGVPKLTDFGIARPVTVSIHTIQGGIPGTVAYMAPETCTGSESDFRSDIYQIGLLMYECISGYMAYPQTVIAAVIDAIKSGTRKPLNTHPKAAAIAKKCLEIDPDKRYQTAQECLADVRALYHIQSPKILPNEQINAFLLGIIPTGNKNVRSGGRVGKYLKIAALVIFGVPLALLLVIGGKYTTDFLRSIIQQQARQTTATEPIEDTPPPSETTEPPPPPVTPPRPKPATAAPAPITQSATQSTQDTQDTQDTQTAPAPEDALNFINEAKNLFAQNKPQEAYTLYQKALKTPSATMTRQEIIKIAIYGSAECNSILFDHGKISRSSYESSWRSVQKAYPAGSPEYAEAAKRLDNGTAE